MQVLIVGVAGPTGRLLAETLVARPDISRVIGIDQVAFAPPLPGVQFVRVRPRQPEWLPLLRDVDAVIHLPGVAVPGAHSAADEHHLVADTRYVVEAAWAAGVPKIMVVTSAALYGPQPGPDITEAAPVRGAELSRYARVRAQVSDYLDAVTQLGYNHLVKERTRSLPIFTRLRLAPLVGSRHTALIQFVRDYPIRARCQRPDQALNVVHEADAMGALCLALEQDQPGIFNVSIPHTGEGDCSLRDLLALIENERACAPMAWNRLRWLGRPAARAWLDLLFMPTLSVSRLLACGWQPVYTSREAVVAALSGDG